MMSERDYQRFASSLIPNIEPDRVLGVRLPLLRKLAGELAREDWSGYLRDAWDGYFEETMLQGMGSGAGEGTVVKAGALFEKVCSKD